MKRHNYLSTDWSRDEDMHFNWGCTDDKFTLTLTACPWKTSRRILVEKVFRIHTAVTRPYTKVELVLDKLFI